MNILICDDDKSMALSIQQAVETYFKEQKIQARIFRALSVEEALKIDKPFDLAFLDIKMGKHSGLDLGYRLKQQNPGVILFIITAYDIYLDDAFDLHAFRFLTKPLDITRLYKGLDAACNRIQSSVFRFHGEYVSLNCNHIVCVYINKRKTQVVTTTESFESTEKLSYWQEQLPAAFFSQPHYSYLVNMNYVVRLEHDFALLIYGEHTLEVPCTQRKRATFKQHFLEFIRKRK